MSTSVDRGQTLTNAAQFLGSRSINVDPDVNETGQAYAYAGDDPVDGVDPMGLSLWSDIGHGVASSFDQFRHGTASLVDLPPSLVIAAGTSIYNTYDVVYQDGANGCSFLSVATQENIGEALFADESAALLADGGEGIEAGSAILDASGAANEAADNIGDFSLSAKHFSGAAGNYSKFAFDVDPSSVIQEALTSENATFLPNPRLPGTFKVVTDLGQVIGTNGQTAVRVIVTNTGKIVTAFPVKG
jgi:hypothetical protein